MSEVSLDIFFTGPEEFGEHIQIKSDDVVAAFQTRAQIIELLQSVNATPRDSDRPRTKFNAAPSQGTPRSDPMERAAAATGMISGAQVSAICPNDGSNLKFVPGGVSRKTNRPYPSFYACNDCGYKVNAQEGK